LLLCFRPEVVIGFGGYISGPILLLASLSKTKTIIHEQNIYPGKTNRILARFVDKVAVTFPETKKYLNRYESKIIISGIPLRKEFKRESIKRDIFSVLIVGGSQGASALNRLVPEAAGLINSERKKEFEVIHISGHRDRDEVIKAYRDKDIKSEVFSFTDEIPKFYNACDFVISRAGAATVSELLFLGKPSILIPYPYAGGHQRLNAAVLRDRGIAVLLEEETLTAEILRDTVIKFMNKDILVEMSGKLKEDTVMDPCDILIKEIVSG
jgi:UDP-N-acetylglucosamine--N-acetylmuramyl-(pentapeptide) pyrophosphoryl-undecaprenol N-acetylglucosamine transferase